MANANTYESLVSQADSILRIRNPSRREVRWRQWQQEVKRAGKSDVALRELPLALTFEALRSDFKMLRRFAVDVLAAEGEPVDSARPIQPSPEAGNRGRPLRVFVSHRIADSQTALGVRKVLAGLGGERLQFFLSEEISVGAQWYRWIRERLLESDLLLLLYTDPDRQWNWSFYETGLFEQLDDENAKRRIICIHSNATGPPDPLAHLQAVPARLQSVRDFLRDLFVRTEISGLRDPIAPWLENAPAELDRASRKIVRLINRSPVTTTYFNESLRLRVTNPKHLEAGEIPGDAVVTSEGGALRIFGLKTGEWKWSDIEEAAGRLGDTRWLREVVDAASLAAAGQHLRPIQATVVAQDGVSTYRPVLYRLDKTADGSLEFRLLFIGDVSGSFRHVPQILGTLLTSLVMGSRFRYEVIDGFGHAIRRTHSKRLIKETVTRVRNAVQTIETEAASRGLLNEDVIVAAFESAEDQARVQDCFAQWYDCRDRLFCDDEVLTPQALERCLAQFRELNKRYMHIASARYSEVVVERMT